MKLTQQTKKTLDEMWAAFGTDMTDLISEFSDIKEMYEGPEDVVAFLNIVEQYVDMKKQ